MKKLLLAFTLMLVTSAYVSDAGAQDSAQTTGSTPSSPIGTWDYVLDIPDGGIGGTLTLTDTDGQLGGTMIGADGQSLALQNVAMAENLVTFDFTTRDFGSGRVQITFSGETFNGHLDMHEFGRFPMRGMRRAAEDTSSDQAAEEKETAVLTTRSPLRDLLNNEQAKAVLEKHFPGLTTNPELEQAYGMSLRALAEYAPDTFTPGALQAVDEDLAKQ